MNDTLLMILIGLMSLTLLVLAWAMIGLLVVVKRELPKLRQQVSDINGRVARVLDEMIPTLQGATHTLQGGTARVARSGGDHRKPAHCERQYSAQAGGRRRDRSAGAPPARTHSARAGTTDASRASNSADGYSASSWRGVSRRVGAPASTTAQTPVPAAPPAPPIRRIARRDAIRRTYRFRPTNGGERPRRGGDHTNQP
jgi:hypothetical protein